MDLVSSSLALSIREDVLESVRWMLEDEEMTARLSATLGTSGETTPTGRDADASAAQILS